MAECVCAGGRAVMLGMSLTLTLACAGNWGHWSERATCQICWLIQKVYFWKDLTHGKHKRQRFSTMDSDRLDQVPLETLTEWIWMKEIEFKNAFKHNSSRQFKCKYHSLLHWNIFFFCVKQAVLHYYYFFCSAQIALTSLSQLGTVLIRDTMPACREYITFLDILKANIYQTQLRCFIPHPALSIIKKHKHWKNTYSPK